MLTVSESVVSSLSDGTQWILPFLPGVHTLCNSFLLRMSYILWLASSVTEMTHHFCDWVTKRCGFHLGPLSPCLAQTGAGCCGLPHGGQRRPTWGGTKGGLRPTACEELNPANTHVSQLGRSSPRPAFMRDYNSVDGDPEPEAPHWAGPGLLDHRHWDMTSICSFKMLC